MVHKLVSIIIPVYNAEKYIEDCINSVLNQTYSFFEIIVIDDGSQDSSASICKKFAEENDMVHYHRIENAGVSNARNVGMTLAKGDYFVFIDSDDKVEPDYLKYLVMLMNKSQMGIVGYTSNQNELGKNQDNAIITEKIAKSIFNQMLSGQPGIDGYLWNKIFDAKIVRENRIQFPMGIKIWEDMDFVLRYLNCISKCSQSNCVLYYYRIHNSSAVQTLSIEKLHSKLLVSKSFLNIDINNKMFTRTAERLYCNVWIEYALHLQMEKQLTRQIKWEMISELIKKHGLFQIRANELKKVIKIIIK